MKQSPLLSVVESRETLPRCIDLSCGGGVLETLAEALWDHSSVADLAPTDRASMIVDHLVGFDLDKNRTDACRRDLKRWAKEKGARTPPNVFHLADVSLLARSTQRDLFHDQPLLDQRFDLVLCDVPFFLLDADTRDRTRANVEWASGRFSSESLFVSALWSMIAENGTCIMTVREQFFRRVYGAEVLRRFSSEISVVDVQRIDSKIALTVQKNSNGDPLETIRTAGDTDDAKLLAEIETRDRLESFIASFPGEAFRTEPFALYDNRFLNLPRDRSYVKEVVTAETASRWHTTSETIFWPYDRDGRALDVLPYEVEQKLRPWEGRLTRREMFGLDMERRGRKWFEFIAMYPERANAHPTLVFTSHQGVGHCAVADQSLPATAGAINIIPTEPEDAYWLCGLLNSALATFWMQQTFAVSSHPELGVTSIEPTASQLREFPVSTDYRAEIESISRAIHDASDSLFREPNDVPFDDWKQAVHDAASRIRVLETELNAWVAKAYSFDAARFEDHAILDERVIVQSAIESSLLTAIDVLIERTRIPIDRPFSVAEVELELSRDPHWRQLIDESAKSVGEVLLSRSVPDDPALIASGEPPFSASDFQGYRSGYPRTNKRESQKRVFALRGALNIPRERFVHLVEWSDALHHPIFACAPFRGHPLSDGIQFDLGRIAEMETKIGEEIPIADLIVRFGRAGWSLAEIRSSLSLLEEHGKVERTDTVVKSVQKD